MDMKPSRPGSPEELGVRYFRTLRFDGRVTIKTISAHVKIAVPDVCDVSYEQILEAMMS